MYLYMYVSPMRGIQFNCRSSANAKIQITSHEKPPPGKLALLLRRVFALRKNDIFPLRSDNELILGICLHNST